MPRSIRFYIRNRWWDEDTSLAVGADMENHTAAKTQTPALDESWRSPQTGGTYISANFGQQRKIGAVILVRCNLTTAGTYRIRVGNTSDFSTNLFDSGAKNRQAYFSTSEIIAAKTSEFFSSGIPQEHTRLRLQEQVIIEELPSEVNAQYVRVDLADVANTMGYLELGTIYAGRILQPSNDLMFNWRIQRDSIVRDGRASCGQYWSSQVRQRTLVSFTLAPQPEATVFRDWLPLQTLTGITTPFIVSLSDRKNSLAFTTSLYGKWVEVPSIQHSAYRHYTIPMQFEEIVG